MNLGQTQNLRHSPNNNSVVDYSSYIFSTPFVSVSAWSLANNNPGQLSARLFNNFIEEALLLSR